MEDAHAALHQRALELVRERYEAVAGVAELGLERLNRSRPPALRYRSRREAVREWMECAGAVSTFAVHLGLISGEEAAQIIREHTAGHPEIMKLLDG